MLDEGTDFAGVLALSLLAGCSMMGEGKDKAPAVITSQNVDRVQGKQWELKKLTIDNRDIVMDLDANMTLIFGTDGKATGFGSVNQFSTTYAFDQDAKVTWGRIVTTRRAGPPELMQKERICLEALTKTSRAIVKGPALQLQSDDGTTALPSSKPGVNVRAGRVRRRSATSAVLVNPSAWTRLMTTTYDAIVIGTGQAGPSLAARLSGAGMSVAVIEQGKFGGTCVNNGCIPTKTLVASAYAAHLARRAAEYGVDIAGPVSVDMKRVKARKDEISGLSNQGVEQWMRGLANGTVYQGHARLVAPKTVQVNDDVLTADKIFINVGGRPLVPKMPGLERVPYLTNLSMMEVDFLPEHLIVIGGSYIGLEFGQMYRRFGSRVTVIEMGHG
jgi:heat shock protein HslJ